jgi:two-component system OmpR family response regulator
VILPAKDRIETEAITANKNRKKRILTIDDDKDTSSSLKIVLEQSGLFEVDAFDDPTQALASFRSNGYDAVILDVKMPYMDGFELYKKIKMLDEKIKVCFLTSVYDFDYYRTLYPDIVHTIEKNEDCIIDKPVGTEQLIKEISKILRSQKGEIIQEK